MKKVLLAGVAALAVVLATDKPASAWVNSRFSVGLNWSYQSGGNNFLWGLFRNGQPPGPEAYGPYGAPHGGFGYGPQYGAAPAPDGGSPAMMPTAPPPSGDARQLPTSTVAQFQPAVWNTPAVYQPVSYYSSPYYPQYSYPQYAYPYPVEGAYGSWAAPQYWGR